MADQLNDFDRQMAEIDKIMAQGGGAKAAPPPARPGASSAPAPSAPATRSAAPAAPRGGKVAVLATWFRLVLAGSLLAAIAVWPFANYCGSGLMLYLGAIGLLIVTSLWALAASWTHRRGFAHVLGLVTLGGALAYGAAEVLPRIGYAKATATWLCTTPAASAASAPVAAPAVTGTTAPAAAPISPAPSAAGGTTAPTAAGSVPAAVTP